MQSLPRISVITPSYNQAQYLEATLRSVLDQDYPALEYIVIDGGSSDGSLAILERYAPRLAYWVSEPDRGQSDAINKGMHRASGDILTWLNSDDVLLPGSLHLVGEVFQLWPQIQWITGRPLNINAQGHIVEMGLPGGYLRGLIRAGFYHGRGMGFIRQEGSFWRRELWQQAGGKVDSERRYTMDFDLWRRMAAHAPLVAVDSPLAAYRYQPQQKTASLEPYYREAGVWQPDAIRLLMLPLRALFGLISLPLLPRVTFRRRDQSWQLHPGLSRLG